MTLDEFLNRPHNFPSNAYVDHPDFESLYVRDTERYIDDKKVPCLDIGNVVAKRKGEGAFTILLDKYQYLNICVECVHQQRFQDYLLRNGFFQIRDFCDPPSYFRWRSSVRIRKLEEEIEFFSSLRQKARDRNPEGCTILDFMAVWNEQYKEKIEKLEKQISDLQKFKKD